MAATFQDLNDAISAAQVKATDSFSAAQAALDAVNGAKTRADNQPGAIDYQPQVDAVNGIGQTADGAKALADQAKAVADTILP